MQWNQGPEEEQISLLNINESSTKDNSNGVGKVAGLMGQGKPEPEPEIQHL